MKNKGLFSFIKSKQSLIFWKENLFNELLNDENISLGQDVNAIISQLIILKVYIVNMY